mmetsp:Transcript_25026/g.80876  ORF Transcript_25026/g.80876 Transcript_25026/m.80876 type:complete len:414 (-) Transcript_25026:181-1422(-)
MCSEQCDAYFIEPFDESNPEHMQEGPHKYRHCPECFRFGDWCGAHASRGAAGPGRARAGRQGAGATSSTQTQQPPLPWMRSRNFERHEAGLKTVVQYEGLDVVVLCVPEVFMIEESVFRLGQEATAGGGRNRNRLFDTAFKLLNEKAMTGSPQSLADALLLLHKEHRPRPTNLAQPMTSGLTVAASASLWNVLEGRIRSDQIALIAYAEEKTAIAEILLDQYNVRGEPIVADPAGWIKWEIRLQSRWPATQDCKCYHGTCMANTTSILTSGLHRPVSRDLAAHGAARGPGVYCSPSWHYSAHPVYAPLQKSNGWPHRAEAFQMLFECVARKDRIEVHRGTLASKHWPRDLRIDPDRDTVEGLEYLVKDDQDVQLTALMFRKFGTHVDEATFGVLPTRVVVPTVDAGFRGGHSQ